jgi:hypothetical protein
MRGGSSKGARITTASGAQVALIVLATVFVALLATAAGPAAASERSRLTIQSWPKGLFGYVRGTADECGDGRKVSVFEQRGARPKPRTDRRFATVKAGSGAGSQWVARTSRTGSFYAKARRTKGCSALRSKVLKVRAGTPGGAGGAGVPACSPYVSEGDSDICRMDQISMKCTGQSISQQSGSCGGVAKGGPYPWGVNGEGGDDPQAQLVWNHNDHSISYASYPFGDGFQHQLSYLRGTIPWGGSANFTIADGWAQDDRGGTNGDHFFTPDVPGQAAGEIGGPLYLNFVNDGSFKYVYIYGYLFLKR